MSADQRLRNVLAQHQVNAAGAKGVALQHIVPLMRHWVSSIDLSGSVAKGTANAGANDMDLFIAMSSNTPGTLKDIYEALHYLAVQQPWSARRQNVSIGIQVAGLNVNNIFWGA